MDPSRSSSSVPPGGAHHPAPSPPLWHVASSFVELYYKTVATSPMDVHRFYSSDSVFSRLEPHHSMGQDERAARQLLFTGQADIHRHFTQHADQGARVLIESIDYQPSLEQSVLLLVHGRLLPHDTRQPARRFVQTVLLARQQQGYFVRNDLLRFVEEETPAPAASSLGKHEPAPCPPPLTEGAPRADQSTHQPTAPASVPQPVDQPMVPLQDERVEPEPLSEPPQEPAPPSPVPTPTPAVLAPTAPAPAQPRTWASMAASKPTENDPVTTSVAPVVTTPVVGAPATPPATPGASRSGSAARSSGTELFVNYVAEETTPAELEELFQGYGPVVRVEIREKRGFGFVTMGTTEGAAAVLEAAKQGHLVLKGSRLMAMHKRNNGWSGQHPPTRGGRTRGRGAGRARPRSSESLKVNTVG